MIESTNTNELQGQYELDDLLPREQGTGNRDIERPEICPVDRFQRDGAGRPKGTGIAEGYDADGHLLNVDYPPLRSGPKGLATRRDYQSPPSSPEPSPVGEGGPRSGPEEVPAAQPAAPADLPPQTSADAARLAALATEINTITEQTRATVISAALAVGKRLIEAKSICPAGRFGEWLATAVSYSERKAQDMMRLYEEYGRNGSIPDSIAALDYSKAVALLAAPADQREALAEQAAEEDLSVRQLQQEIKRLKEEAVSAQQTIFNQDYALKRAAREREDLDEAHADTVANLNAARDALSRKEEDFYAALDQKEAELKEAKRVIADAAEKVSVAQAKTAAAESAAEQLKRLRAEAEERADQNAQRYGDALKRANDTAKELAEAKAKIVTLSEAAAAAAPEPERVEVEVVPEAVQRELEQLKRDLAEARSLQKPSPGGEGGPRSGSDEVPAATAAEKFKWFYQNQMQPTFKQALTLLKEVAREDGHAADAFATAMTNACKVLMNQLGTSGN